MKKVELVKKKVKEKGDRHLFIPWKKWKKEKKGTGIFSFLGNRFTRSSPRSHGRFHTVRTGQVRDPLRLPLRSTVHNTLSHGIELIRDIGWLISSSVIPNPRGEKRGQASFHSLEKVEKKRDRHHFSFAEMELRLSSQRAHGRLPYRAQRPNPRSIGDALGENTFAQHFVARNRGYTEIIGWLDFFMPMLIPRTCKSASFGRGTSIRPS